MQSAAQQSVRLSYDDSTLEFLAELRSRLSRLSEAVHKPVNLLNLIRDLSPRSAAIHFELMRTGRAIERRIILKPSDALLRLMTALRAWDGESDCVAQGRP